MLCKTVNKLDAKQQRLYDKAVKELFPVPQEFAVSWYCFAYVGDAFAGEALVHIVGIHYEADTIGSRTITTK